MSDLYHGTRAGFRGSGGLVLPGDLVGKDNHGLKRSDAVYLTPDLELAWDYARACKGRGRPRVLVVRPMSELEMDDSTVGEEEQESYRCSGARVLRTLTEEKVPCTSS